MIILLIQIASFYLLNSLHDRDIRSFNQPCSNQDIQMVPRRQYFNYQPARRQNDMGRYQREIPRQICNKLPPSLSEFSRTASQIGRSRKETTSHIIRKVTVIPLEINNKLK